MENEGKLRLLYIGRILWRRTDEEHPLSTSQIMGILKDEYGIDSHRTTVSADIEVLREFGIDICKIESTQNKYFVANRTFEVPELKLLMDAVEASGVLTEKKSRHLIEKIGAQGGEHTAEKLKESITPDSTVKHENEKIYYIIDAVCDAINNKKRITFHYYGYDETKTLRLKNGGEPYEFSPYALIPSNDHYYMVGYSHKHDDIGNFRLDRVADIPKIAQIGVYPQPKGFNVAAYARTLFRMFSGEVRRVELVCEGDTMNSIVDHFGNNITVEDIGGGRFRAEVDAAISPVFYRWIFGFEGKIRIKAPEEVKEEYREMIKKAAEAIME